MKAKKQNLTEKIISLLCVRNIVNVVIIKWKEKNLFSKVDEFNEK